MNNWLEVNRWYKTQFNNLSSEIKILFFSVDLVKTVSISLPAKAPHTHTPTW